MHIRKAFFCRLNPNKSQKSQLANFAGGCRYIYNKGLEERKRVYEEENQTLRYFDQNLQLTKLKKEEATRWLTEIHSQTLQQSLRDLDLAFQNFFRRIKQKQKPGYPKFKSKGIRDSFRYQQGVKIKENQAYLPKIGWIKFRKSREIEGTLEQTTISRRGDHWYISFFCKIEKQDPLKAPITEENAIGIAKRQLAKLHAKIRHARENFAHQLSTSIVKSHDIICVESLNIQALMQNKEKRLSRSIADAGWRQFLTYLKYNAHERGRHFVETGKYFPSSQLCSLCGHKQKISLGEREYHCQNCNLQIDRDYNREMLINCFALRFKSKAPKIRQMS